MSLWSMRSREEKHLLNPAFCAQLIWHAASGYTANGSGALSFEESFLVLPFVLHRQTREGLPRSTRTSLAVWLEDHPMARGRIASRARMLVPFTKDALTFGGQYGLFRIENGLLRPEKAWTKTINRVLRESSKEVNSCVKRADFVGKWFSETGKADTVLAIIGVRP